MQVGFTKKNLLAMFWSCFAANIIQLFMVVLAYVYDSFPYIDAKVVVMVATLPSLLTMFCNLALGGLMKLKINKKFYLILGLLIYIAEAIMIVTLKGDIYAILFAVCIGGIAASLLGTGTDVIFAEYDPSGKLFAWNRSFTGLAMTIFNLVTGIICSDGHWERTGILLFIIAAPGLVFMLLWGPNMKVSNMAEMRGQEVVVEKGEEVRGIGGVPFLIIVLVAYFCFQVGIYAHALNYSSYVITWFHLGTSATTGYIGMIMAGGTVVVGFFVDKVMAKIGGLSMIIASVAWGACLVLMTAIHTLPVFIFCAVLEGCTNIIMHTTACQYVTNYGIKNTSLGVCIVVCGCNVSVFLTPYIVDYLAKLFSTEPVAQFAVGAVFCGVAAVMSVVAYGMIKKFKKQAAALNSASL